MKNKGGFGKFYIKFTFPEPETASKIAGHRPSYQNVMASAVLMRNTAFKNISFNFAQSILSKIKTKNFSS
jgi:hypothetical protein